MKAYAGPSEKEAKKRQAALKRQREVYVNKEMGYINGPEVRPWKLVKKSSGQTPVTWDEEKAWLEKNMPNHVKLQPLRQNVEDEAALNELLLELEGMQDE